VVYTIHQPGIDIFEAFDEVSEISHMITSSYPLLSFWLAFGHILVLLWLFFSKPSTMLQLAKPKMFD
jgi:hypothetical protein